METEGLLPMPADAPTLPAGAVIGRCRIIRLIATGGQGSIYLAHHQALDKQVVLKILPPALSGDEEFVRRFQREARSAAKLEHPNIVQIFDAASENGLYYIIMQYVDGRDLQGILDKKGKAPVNDALAITKRVALALGTAHRAGIMHRDIKPSNIMISRQGKVMITDFGLARDLSGTMSATITQGGFVMGTPDYLSPEQAMGERTDARSDIYSLGATLYRMLAGQPPYPDGDVMTVMMKHVRENEHPAPLRSLNPDVPPAVEGLVSKMMAKSPSQRYPTMEEVAAAIDTIKGSRGTTLVDSLAVPAVRRRMWINMAIGIAIGVAAVILLILVLRPDPAERALRDAQVAETRTEGDPLQLDGVIKLYSKVADKYPNTAQAAYASERLMLLKARYARAKLEARLSEIEQAYPDRRSYAVCAGEIREVIQGRPPANIDARARDLLRSLSRQEILSRAQRVVEFVRLERLDEVIALIDPEDRKSREVERLRLALRTILGAAAGDPSKVEVTLHADRLTVDVERSRAELPAASTFRHNNGTTTTRECVWRWKAVNDTWYLDIKE